MKNKAQLHVGHKPKHIVLDGMMHLSTRLLTTGSALDVEELSSTLKELGRTYTFNIMDSRELDAISCFKTADEITAHCISVNAYLDSLKHLPRMKNEQRETTRSDRPKRHRNNNS